MTAAVHPIRPEDERWQLRPEDIRRVVGEELISQRLLAPRDEPRLPPVDEEAERALIALAECGCAVEAPPELWGRSLHKLVFLAIGEAFRLGLDPTPQIITQVLMDDGFTASIRPWVEDLLFTPVTMTAGEALRRMERVARRREMLTQVETLDVLLRCPGSDSAATLEAIRELGRLAHG